MEDTSKKLEDVKNFLKDLADNFPLDLEKDCLIVIRSSEETVKVSDTKVEAAFRTHPRHQEAKESKYLGKNVGDKLKVNSQTVIYGGNMSLTMALARCLDDNENFRNLIAKAAMFSSVKKMFDK